MISPDTTMTPGWPTPERVDEQTARYACAEAYQVLGVLAVHAGLFKHPDVIRALGEGVISSSINLQLTCLLVQVTSLLI